MLKRCAIVLVVCLTGCHEASVADLPGTYRAKGTWGESQLILNPDHTMEQTIKLSEGETQQLSGKWEAGSGSISLVPCFSLRHDKVGERMGGCSTGFYEYRPGSIEISLDPDFGIAYRK